MQSAEWAVLLEGGVDQLLTAITSLSIVLPKAVAETIRAVYAYAICIDVLFLSFCVAPCN